MEEILKNAISKHRDGDFKTAEILYLEVLEKNPEHFNAVMLLGTLYIQLNQFQQALEKLNKAHYAEPKNIQVIQNMAIAYRELEKPIESLKFLDKGLEMDKNFYSLYFHKAILLKKIGKYEESLKNFYEYSNHDKSNYYVYLQIANIKYEQKKYSDALHNFDLTIKLNPKCDQAFSNKGLTLSKYGLYNDAIDCYKKAIQINNTADIYFYNLASCLRANERPYEAITNFIKAKKLNPNNIQYFFEEYVTYAFINDFDKLEKYKTKFISTLKNSKIGFDPFSLLFLIDDPNILLQNAKKNSLNLSLNRCSFEKKINKNKINIAYISSDFRNHPISRLTIDLIKTHNRNKFNIYGFSTINSNDDLHETIKKEFDNFFYITNHSDDEKVKFIKEKNIDIAIDLGGFTRNSNLNIFKHRLAPIQISYLGYLGSTGSTFIDYILADSVLINKDLEKFYTEKIIYLPHYQANSPNKKISTTNFSKNNYQFPLGSFVFASFNNNFKISYKTFNSWINILNKVKRSVMLIYVKSIDQKKMLFKQFESKKINSNRIFFAEPLKHEDYLSRFKCVDIILDTYPYNAGTTASDALFMKTPIITLIGKTFSSRMCSSILKSANLQDLITTSWEDYESLAIKLGNNPNEFKKIKERLKSIHHTDLFNIKKFTKNFEYGLLESIHNYNNKKFKNITIN